MYSELISKLKGWDGVHTSYLIELYKANASKAGFFKSLVTICLKEQKFQKATTWLLKHHYETGKRLPLSLTENFLLSAEFLDCWEAKLHLLQLIPHIKLTDNSIPKTDDFVRTCLKNPNKFVRAWAYNGLFELSKYIPEMKSELEFICQRGMETESAAVKSRIKKILLVLNKRK